MPSPAPVPQGLTVPIEPFDLLFREIQLRFAFLNPFTQARAAELISSGKIAIAPLISHEIPLEAAAEIIAASKGEGAAIKKKDDTHRMAEANKAFSHFRF